MLNITYCTLCCSLYWHEQNLYSELCFILVFLIFKVYIFLALFLRNCGALSLTTVHDFCLLASDFSSGALQVNLKEQGQLIRQDEFMVTFRKKKCFRHIFLFQELILFSKTRKTDVGNDTYIYKQSFKVRVHARTHTQSCEVYEPEVAVNTASVQVRTRHLIITHDAAFALQHIYSSFTEEKVLFHYRHNLGKLPNHYGEIKTFDLVSHIRH